MGGKHLLTIIAESPDGSLSPRPREHLSLGHVCKSSVMLDADAPFPRASTAANRTFPEAGDAS